MNARAVLVVVPVVYWFASTVLGQPVATQPAPPARAAASDLLHDRASICTYPRRRPVEAFGTMRTEAVIRTDEVEPNNTPDKAQPVPLGFGEKQDRDVDLSADIKTPFDEDWFGLSLERGQVLGVACLNLDPSGDFDPRIEVRDAAGELLIGNDNHANVGNLFPPKLQLPVGAHPTDAVVALGVPKAGKYRVRVRGVGASTGRYFLQLRLRRPAMREELVGAKQVIFLDFNGQQIDNGRRTFGVGARDTIKLSALSAFLSRWGLQAADEGAVIDAIVGNVRKAFADLEGSSFNDGSGNPGAFGVEVTNSRDHPDRFATDPLVSRVIVGGTIDEFGISTIGLSQFVDPGNFSTNDTAVVLLDLLSEAPDDPNSIRSLQISMKDAGGGTRTAKFDDLPRAQKIAVIGRVVGTVVLHEAGHFLGCFHCRNDNDVACVMDEGGNLLNMAGVGPDGILGTADDRPPRIVQDVYAHEIFTQDETQAVEAMFVFALCTGTRTPETRLAELEAQQLRLTVAQLKPEALPSEVLASNAAITVSAGAADVAWTAPKPNRGFDLTSIFGKDHDETSPRKPDTNIALVLPDSGGLPTLRFDPEIAGLARPTIANIHRKVGDNGASERQRQFKQLHADLATRIDQTKARAEK